MTQPFAIVVFGCPGSGKTTFIQKTKLEKDVAFLIAKGPLLDAIQLGKRKYTKSATAFTEHLYMSALEFAVSQKLNLIIEMTGATVKKRQVILSRLDSYYTLLVQINTPPESCLARALSDPSRPTTTDWKTIISNWHKTYEPPSQYEAGKFIVIDNAYTLHEIIKDAKDR